MLVFIEDDASGVNLLCQRSDLAFVLLGERLEFSPVLLDRSGNHDRLELGANRTLTRIEAMHLAQHRNNFAMPRLGDVIVHLDHRCEFGKRVAPKNTLRRLVREQKAVGLKRVKHRLGLVIAGQVVIHTDRIEMNDNRTCGDAHIFLLGLRLNCTSEMRWTGA